MIESKKILTHVYSIIMVACCIDFKPLFDLLSKSMIHCRPENWRVNIRAKLGSILFDTIEEYASKRGKQTNP